MPAGLVIGGWFASAAISKLADAIRSYIGSKYEYQGTDVKDKLKSLESNMRKIKAAIHEADQRHIENPGLKEWLLELKDACYDAEDVIDMFEYHLLEDKVKGKNQVSSDFALASRKFSKRTCVIVKRFLFCDDELNDLLETVERFDKLVKEMEGLLHFLISLIPTNHAKVDEIMLSRETTSIPVESHLFGRDEERIRLKGLLLQTDDDDARRKHVHFFSIVGTGGVGKTSLARDVYNDPTLTNHFNLRAWVCVSNNFDVKRLVKEIIDSASIRKPHDFHSLQNLDRIAEILKKGLMGKRFLIILDDIWDEPQKNWEVLLSILNSGLDGSRVIITTRFPILASMMKAKSITLKGLQGKKYWNLFANFAFGGESPRKYPALESFGKQIVKKLRGNPLAAKTVGAVLNQNLEVGHWIEILESNLWEVGQINDGIMPVLKLSYDYLPAHLKPCFVYSSLFPKDYKYSEDELVQLWTAQGFIQPLGSKNMEEIGKVYLRELRSRCFLEIIYRGRYVIHDLLHDLAEYLFEGELLRVEDYLPEMKLPERVRHAYIHCDNLSLLCKNEYAKKYLRSLVVHGPCNVSLDILREMKGIRVLIILDLHAGLSPKSMGQMLHLRCLKIFEGAHSSCNITESITKLYHLQVLEVPNLRFFPKGTNTLICLRHLFIPEDTNLAEIRRMTSLQELRFRTRKDEHGYEIGQLRDLLQLRSLSISGLESVESKKEACTTELCKKRNLENLKLVWQKRGHYANSEDVLEGLKPHQNLKDLEIWNYGGRSPSWLNGNWLSNLSSIVLRNCEKWDILPPLGHLPSLHTLKLFTMGAVRKIGSEFYGSYSGVAFRSLESLTLWGMPELEDWCSNVDGLQLFPCLLSLEVSQCPKLRGHFFLPSPLTELCASSTSAGHYISRNGKALSPDRNWLSNLTTIVLSGYASWDTLPPLGHLPSLGSLKLRKMGAVRKIGLEFYGSCSGVAFPSLKSLWIEGMPELEEWCSNIEGLQLFPCLSFLRVRYCPKLRGPLYVPSPLTRLTVQISKDKEERPRLPKSPSMWVSCPAITRLPEWIPRHNLASVEFLSIHDSEEIMELDQTTLPTEVAEWFQHLTSLETLLLMNCPNLQSLPSILTNGPCKLSVHCCPAVGRLPEEGLPSSLMELRIYKCPLLEERCRKDGPDWHKVAHIPKITINLDVIQDQETIEVEVYEQGQAEHGNWIWIYWSSIMGSLRSFMGTYLGF